MSEDKELHHFSEEEEEELKEEIKEELKEELQKEEEKKGPRLVLTGKKLIAGITAIITIMGTIIGFAVKFQTSHLKFNIEKLENDKIKIAEKYNNQINELNKQIKECGDIKTNSQAQQQYKQLLPEYLFLRYSYLYAIASTKYARNGSKENLENLKNAAKRLARFVFTYRKQITEGKDIMDVELEFSSERITFSKNSYLLPKSIIREIEKMSK